MSDALLVALRAADSPDHALALLRDSPLVSEPPAGLDRFPESVAACVESLDPGAVTAGLLEALTPADRVSGRARLRMIAGLDRQIARLQAQQASWIASFVKPGIGVGYGELIELALHGRTSRLGADELSGLIPDRLYEDPEACARILARHPEWEFELAELAAKTSAAEVGAVMGLSPRSAANRVRDARRLVDDYPSSLEEMLAGRIDRLKVSILADELDFVDPDLRPELEQEALSEASQYTAGRFGKRLRQLAITLDPPAADRHAEQTRASRKVRVSPGEDDSARFTADLPADQALLAWAVLNHTADRLPDEIRNGRSLDQLRADIFAGIFSDLAAYGRADLRHPELLPESLRPSRPPESAAGRPDGTPSVFRGSAKAGDDEAGDPGSGTTSSPGTTSSGGPGSTSSPGTTSCDDPGATNVDSAGTRSSRGANGESEEHGPVWPEPWSPCQGATVVIAASTLAGLDNDPAKLAGYGWITAGYGRALAASASSIRIAVHHDLPASHQSPPASDSAPPAGTGRPDRFPPPDNPAPAADPEPPDNPIPATGAEPPDNPTPATGPEPPDNPTPATDPEPPDNPTPATDPEPPDNPTPATGASGEPAASDGVATAGTGPIPADADHRQPCSGQPGHQACSADGRATGSIDRACGSDLDNGRAVYRPPVAVADHVVGRDQTCRFPGCSRAAEACDLDHRQPFGSGGPTCPCNLDALCRPHHRPKTFLEWRAIRLPANHLLWTSPHGYQIVDHPEPQPVGKPFTAAELTSAKLDARARPHQDLPVDDPPPF